MFKDKVVIVTGGANGIGRCIADEFRSQGAEVCVIDKQEGEHFVGDISRKEVLDPLELQSEAAAHHLRLKPKCTGSKRLSVFGVF